MTLTTDRQQFAAQNEMSMEFVNWFFDEKKEGCGSMWFIMAAAMWEGWKGQAANREAQPVVWGAPKTVGQMIGQLQTLDPALETTALLRMPADILDGNAVRQVPISISFEKLNGQWLAPYKDEGRKVLAFWAKADDREETERGELFTSPQSPSYPERLPCPVHLLPGLKLGKGIPTSTLLAALARRAEYNAEMEAMTPEERAEHDARAKLFKAMLPQPAPEI